MLRTEPTQTILTNGNSKWEYSDYLAHFGILGMRWGIRRYQPYPKDYKGSGREVGAAKTAALKSFKKAETGYLKNWQVSGAEKANKRISKLTKKQEKSHFKSRKEWLQYKINKERTVMKYSNDLVNKELEKIGQMRYADLEKEKKLVETAKKKDMYSTRYYSPDHKIEYVESRMPLPETYYRAVFRIGRDWMEQQRDKSQSYERSLWATKLQATDNMRSNRVKEPWETKEDYAAYRKLYRQGLQHSAKGSTWEQHKYIKRIDGTYYYPDSYEGGRHLPDGEKNRGSEQVDIDKLEESDVQRLAEEGIRGNFGNGQERKEALGAHYQQVQDRINQILGVGGGSGVGSTQVAEVSPATKDTGKAAVEKVVKKSKGIDLNTVYSVYKKQEQRKNKSAQKANVSYNTASGRRSVR